MSTISIDIKDKINNLEKDIENLKVISEANEIDLSDKINDLEIKLKKFKKEISPYDKVVLSRDIKRPTTKDYIDIICS